MLFEWDERKRIANAARHGVDFSAVLAFDWEAALVGNDDREDYGEPRSIAVGPIGTRIHVLVFAARGAAVRVISLRKANDREVKLYEKALAG